jgi:hypothetical protein
VGCDKIIRNGFVAVGAEEEFFFLFFHAPIVSKACSLVNGFYKISNTLMDHYRELSAVDFIVGHPQIR